MSIIHGFKNQAMTLKPQKHPAGYRLIIETNIVSCNGQRSQMCYFPVHNWLACEAENWIFCRREKLTYNCSFYFKAKREIVGVCVLHKVVLIFAELSSQLNSSESDDYNYVGNHHSPHCECEEMHKKRAKTTSTRKNSITQVFTHRNDHIGAKLPFCLLRNTSTSSLKVFSKVKYRWRHFCCCLIVFLLYKPAVEILVQLFCVVINIKIIQYCYSGSSPKSGKDT